MNETRYVHISRSYSRTHAMVKYDSVSFRRNMKALGSIGSSKQAYTFMHAYRQS